MGCAHSSWGNSLAPGGWVCKVIPCSLSIIKLCFMLIATYTQFTVTVVINPLG